MTWLEDTLRAIAASGEGAVNLGPPMTEREREMQALVKGGGYGAPDMTNPAIRLALGDGPAPIPNGRMPFSIGGDPMTAGGMMPNGSGLPVTDPMIAGGLMPNGPGGDMASAQAGNRLVAGNPALSFPTSQPVEKYTDYASGYPIEATRPTAQFPDMASAPVGPPQMAAQAAIPGLNSPMGGGGAPFSIAGAPPSLVAAKEMTAPPPAAPMTQQAAVPGLVPPGAAPGVPGAPAGAPVVAKGGDDEDAPVGAPTDASARRRDVAVAPMGAAPQLPPPEPSFGERMQAGGKGIAAALREASPTLIALGQGLSGGGWGTAAELAAARNKRDEGLALQAQQGNATARLLAAKGASPSEISAAIAAGPDVTKALVAQYLGKDKFKVVQTGENDRGRKTFQLMNEQDGTFKDIPGAVVAADSPSDAAAAAGITGESFLKTVPNAQDRSLIKQLTQYDLDPGKLSAKGGNRERLLALAEQFDPDYKAALYAPRAAALKEFTSGGQTSPAAIITNGNTAIQHLGRMSELADKLGGTNKGWILNGAINWANVTLEDMKNNPDLARFKGAQDRFVEEATKFYRGVGGNKSDIDRALHILTAAQSPEARQAAIQEQAELMGSKINALQDRFKSAVGPSGWKKAMDMAGTEFPIVQQKSAEELDKIRKRAAGERVDDPGKKVKPGNYVYRNGVLVPE